MSDFTPKISTTTTSADYMFDDYKWACPRCETHVVGGMEWEKAVEKHIRWHAGEDMLALSCEILEVLTLVDPYDVHARLNDLVDHIEQIRSSVEPEQS